MDTEHTLATWKANAREVWKVLGPAESTRALAYISQAKAKPAKIKAKVLYQNLPQGWQDSVEEASFGATLSLAGRIVREFEEQKSTGHWPNYKDVESFVKAKKSLKKSLQALNPAKVEPAKVEPSKSATSKSVEVSTKVEESPKVDKFAQVVALVDELNEVDLQTLAMVVADRLAKFQAKATAKA